MDDQAIEKLVVLDVERLVERELVRDELEACCRGLVTAALHSSRVLRPHEEDHERDERDHEEEQQRPEDSPDEVSEHLGRSLLPGSYLAHTLLVPVQST